MFEIISPRCAFIHGRITKQNVIDLKRWISFQQSQDVIDSVLFIDSLGGYIDEELVYMLHNFNYTVQIMRKAYSSAAIIAMMASVIYAQPDSKLVFHALKQHEDDVDGKQFIRLTRKIQDVFAKVLPRTGIRYELFMCLTPFSEGVAILGIDAEEETLIDKAGLIHPDDLDLVGEFYQKYKDLYDDGPADTE